MKAGRTWCLVILGGAGCLGEPLPFGPAGEDVVSQVIDQPHCPDEQRCHGLLGDGVGRVFPGPAGGRGRQVVISAELIPQRPADAVRACAELVECP